MYPLIRKLLFLLPPETAHLFTTYALKMLLTIPGTPSLIRNCYAVKGQYARKIMGLDFPNPIGLAAGFDKNAELIREWNILGFGFIEVGTVTPKAQAGNEKPRLFRLKSDKALINRMGFNNHGLDPMIEKLKKRPKNVIVGGNIGKNKLTANNDAVKDYVKCFEALFPYVDYFVVNVSSPNTPNLRDLQEKAPLLFLLNTLAGLNKSKPNPRPILLKIAPDLNDEQLDDILEIVEETGITGIIATNTTVSRSGLATNHKKIEMIGQGGLSGRPLNKRSNEIIRYLRTHNSKMVIIGVGGIMNEESAMEKLASGADLIQLYSGFVYEGPTLLKRIKKAILRNIEEA